MPTPSAREQAIAAYPDFPFAAPAIPSVTAVMQQVGYLDSGKQIKTVTRAGEGNMNLTLRVGLSDGSSVILKQSRPWVEKYDAIAAPFERAVIESRFYAVAGRIPEVARRMPALLGADKATRTLLLQDLGEASDLFGIYSGAALTARELDAAAAWLQALHTSTRSMSPAEAAGFENMEMRELNHAHIFRIPLTPHGYLDLESLEPGLSDAAAGLRGNSAYTQAVEHLGEVYLGADGPVLLHGDFFPGSLLRTGEGLIVIDPEFCFRGPAAWDLGVFVAHLALADCPVEDAMRFLDAYTSPFDTRLMGQFAAVEVMRRLIGVAQLPLGHTTGRRSALLLRSRAAVLAAQWQRLWEVGA